ncbi:VOC family protein [Phenylobacterium sp.]|uniref:VOC family protein n=1 Tax=Phenylobacterium sp. TaxID=1871053 RepID=UPI002C3904FF|nr:VOC family protein [Phenylobacterium sp.]HVI30708.1 VOC family protein [Phenylobacterium sp.]
MSNRRPNLTSAISYRDPKAALEFLERAFGFELFMRIDDAEGNLVHSEMRFGDSVVMVGSEWSEETRSPASIGGKTTQTIHIHVDEDVDAHCARARAAGFEIIMAPADQFYGDRTYRCRDPEGHIWTVGQTVKPVTREEAEAASGLKIEGWV